MNDEFRDSMIQLSGFETPREFGDTMTVHPDALTLLKKKIGDVFSVTDTGKTFMGMRILESRAIPIDKLLIRDQNGKIIFVVNLKA
jgi:hypothetical protein